jgi:hypothetical protein
MSPRRICRNTGPRWIPAAWSHAANARDRAFVSRARVRHGDLRSCPLLVGSWTCGPRPSGRAASSLRSSMSSATSYERRSEPEQQQRPDPAGRRASRCRSARATAAAGRARAARPCAAAPVATGLRIPESLRVAWTQGHTNICSKGSTNGYHHRCQPGREDPGDPPARHPSRW